MRPLCTVLVLLALLQGCKRRPPYEGRSASELGEMLQAEDAGTQAQAAYGLGRQGTDAREAVPGLLKSLTSPSSLVRQQAALALGRIGSADAVPALTEALRDPEWSVRRQAALALGQIGPPALPAEPELRKLLLDPNSLVRKGTQAALERISSGTYPAGKSRLP
jgi:HEAT repeat protein